MHSRRLTDFIVLRYFRSPKLLGRPTKQETELLRSYVAEHWRRWREKNLCWDSVICEIWARYTICVTPTRLKRLLEDIDAEYSGRNRPAWPKPIRWSVRTSLSVDQWQRLLAWGRKNREVIAKLHGDPVKVAEELREQGYRAHPRIAEQIIRHTCRHALKEPA